MGDMWDGTTTGEGSMWPGRGPDGSLALASDIVGFGGGIDVGLTFGDQLDGSGEPDSRAKGVVFPV